MNYKKKSCLAVALMVLVAIFLTACTSVLLQPESSKDAENNQPDALGVVNVSNPTNYGEIVIKHLATSDLYANGHVFISAFQSKMTTLSVPDARHGERAVDINEGRDYT